MALFCSLNSQFAQSKLAFCAASHTVTDAACLLGFIAKVQSCAHE